MREPHVLAEVTERLDVVDRPRAELLQAELLLVVGLGEVGVQPDAEPARELCATSRISSPVTENGEHGASAIRSIESGAGSW